MTQSQQADARKSTTQYWDENWRRHGGSQGAQLLNQGGGYFWRRIDQSLDSIFSRLGPGEHRLIEIGAGASEWLPYLHRRFGFAVHGLDYSEVGCQRARENLAALGVPGEIHLADMFSPPEELCGSFDVVVSFGVIEHFGDTAAALTACSRYARPGGLVVTMIPNMKGLYGQLYQLFDRRVFDIHVPLDLDDLSKAHRQAGLPVASGEYLLGLPGVVDKDRIEPVLWRRIARTLVFRLSRAYWWLEEHGLGFRENRLTSPYIICSATKPATGHVSEG